MNKYAIGIDIGGTNTVFGIVDKSGKIIAKNKISTRDYDKIDIYIDELSKSINQLINSISTKFKIIGIGIGAPNGNFFSGTIEFAPNLIWKGIIPIVDLLKKNFDLPIFLTNDANAAAIGEMVYGGAKEMDNFVIITLGTGLGSGIVVNKKLVYGHDGFAGEIGHVNIIPEGRVCGCGRRGCLETYASATGICRTAFEMMSEYMNESELRNIAYNDLTAFKIYEAAKNNDEIALKSFDYTAYLLGKSLADTIAYFSPQAIFLFGGLANAQEYLLKPTKDYMEKYLLPIFKNKVSILPSKIESGNAAILGASALVWNELK